MDPQFKEDKSSETRGKTSDVREATSMDPLRWFGMFVSPKLRQVQSNFAEPVEGAIPALVNIDTEMKSLEIEIRRTRKQISKLDR